MIRPFVKEIIEDIENFPLNWREIPRGIKRDSDSLSVELPPNRVFFLCVVSPRSKVDLGFQESWFLYSAMKKWKQKATLHQFLDGKIIE
jgi:hypothetical protein